jgi:ATP synthase F1 complex assembly factor 1
MYFRLVHTSPFFVQPVFRDGGFFMLITQFQEPSHFLMAYLEDYKLDPARAQPLLTFSVFDDLIAKPKIDANVGLVRVDVVNPGIRDDEGLKVVQNTLDAYCNEDEFFHVKTFNKSPNSFDVDDFISFQNQKWKTTEEDTNNETLK